MEEYSYLRTFKNCLQNFIFNFKKQTSFMEFAFIFNSYKRYYQKFINIHCNLNYVRYNNCIQLYESQEVNVNLTNSINGLTRISTKDIAYEQVKERIIKMELEPDSTINRVNLESELGVSRTPMREALQKLEGEGLVVQKSNGTFKVAPMSKKEVRELFKIRSKLEGILIEEAINNLDEKSIETLTYLTDMIKVTSKLKSRDETENYGSRFHEEIYRLSGNEIALVLLDQLNDRINRYRNLAHDTKVGIESSSHEHEVILKLMIEKNTDKAVQTLETHIMNAQNAVVQALDNINTN